MAEDTEHRVDATEVAKQVLAGLSKSDAKDVSEALIRENVIAREQRREAEAERDALKAKLPPDGAVVLTKDDAKRWEAFQALEIDPEKVGEAITERDELKAKDAAREKRDAMNAAASAAGWTPDVLAQVHGATDLDYKVEREKDGEQTVDVAYVKQGDGKWTKAGEYAEEHWPALLPALKAEAPTGTRYPKQGTADKAPTTKGYDPVAAGKELAAKQKAQAPDQSLALR